MSDDFLPIPEEEEDEPTSEATPRQFIRGGLVSELAPGKSKSIWLKNRKVAVFNVGGRMMACKDRCTHMGALLSEGRVQGESVVCAWHGWTFDLGSGRCTNKEWASVETYRVRVVGDSFEIEMPIE